MFFKAITFQLKHNSVSVTKTGKVVYKMFMVTSTIISSKALHLPIPLFDCQKKEEDDFWFVVFK